MESTCQEAIKILEEQKKLYSQLTDLSMHKQQHLIKGNLEALNEVTRQEESLIFQLGKLEEKREACFTLLAELFGFDGNSTLQEILPQLPLGSQGQLKQIQEDFFVLIRELTQLNQENTSLLQQSLRFVNFTVEAINQQSKPLYNAEQEVKAEQLNNLLDKKV
jgi:flagellar biosynthesis/type III secretory pathway chaperone